MSALSRRQLLQSLATTPVAIAGTFVVLARTVLAATQEAPAEAPAAPDERADRLVEGLPAPPEDVVPVSFVNRAVRAGAGGAFRNGGFANGARGGGAFRNGGFANGRGGGGAFRNGGFANGARGGAVRGGAFRNF
jgi:hypothetical protein